MNAQDLTIPALVGLPVVAAYFLGLFARSVLSGGRSWVLWLVCLGLSCVVWGLVFSGTP